MTILHFPSRSVIVVCECGERRPTKEFADLWAFLISPGHGHIAHKILFQCPCGEELETFMSRNSPVEEITAWLNYHIVNHSDRE